MQCLFLAPTLACRMHRRYRWVRQPRGGIGKLWKRFVCSARGSFRDSVGSTLGSREFQLMLFRFQTQRADVDSRRSEAKPIGRVGIGNIWGKSGWQVHDSNISSSITSKSTSSDTSDNRSCSGRSTSSDKTSGNSGHLSRMLHEWNQLSRMGWMGEVEEVEALVMNMKEKNRDKTGEGWSKWEEEAANKHILRACIISQDVRRAVALLHSLPKEQINSRILHLVLIACTSCGDYVAAEETLTYTRGVGIETQQEHWDALIGYMSIFFPFLPIFPIDSPF